MSFAVVHNWIHIWQCFSSKLNILNILLDFLYVRTMPIVCALEVTQVMICDELVL